MINKEEICVVWLKRDLRLNDNEAIKNAINSGKKILFLYVFEKILLSNPNHSTRHWNFVKQSIIDINKDLKKHNTRVLTVNATIFTAFNQLSDIYKISNIFSHEETGLLTTYNRNKEFSRYCRNNEINWIENSNNGVSKNLPNHEEWMQQWEEYMQLPIIKFEGDNSLFLSSEAIDKLSKYFNITDLETPKNTVFQNGGTSTAWKYATVFFDTHQKKQVNSIVPSIDTLTNNSRLSPYISWGNISVREIFQKALLEKEKAYDERFITTFLSRIRWQAGFNQKFKTEATMENSNIHKGLQKLKSNISEEYIKAWKEGQTGFPLIDASMRCLNETGYLDFRKRTVVVSFFTNILWQPWQAATHHLSKMFLDFDPSIHFPQLQTQSNNNNIYKSLIQKPTNSNINNDLDIPFIIKWVPELEKLSIRLIKRPYLMTQLEQKLNNFKPGENYPLPIVKVTR